MAEKFDLIVIGAGPGGYTAALRAAPLKMKVACIEKEKRLGGVCLRVGCIPSKALLDSSEYYHLARERFAEHGIKTGDLGLDLSAMMKRKDQVVEDLTGNVRKLLEGNKVTVIQGTARLAGGGSIALIDPEGGRQTLEAKSILLATGSEPIFPKGLEYDGDRIVGSAEALSFSEVPKHLCVVGGGYIGLEIGSVWMRLGSRVTVIEMLPNIAAAMDGQVARTLKRILDRQGMKFMLKSRVKNAKAEKDKVTVTVDSGKKEEAIECDRLLVAVGRKPRTGGLGLSEAGVETDAKTGHIVVDEGYRTSVPSIYAIGDLIPGPMLAHKASAEGVAVAERLAGLPGEVNYDTIPSVIYTWPEAASVGITEEQAKERGIPYSIGTFPFLGNGRARCLGEQEGLVKVIAHAKTDRLLGVHIIGARAADMIAECVLAMEFNAGAEDLARVVHGHPTFAEALQEAAHAVKKQ